MALAALAATGAVTAFGAVTLFGGYPSDSPSFFLVPPLLLAGTLFVATAALVVRRTMSPAPAAFALTLTAGLAIGWALAAHTADDLVGSRVIRRSNARHLEEIRALLPESGPVLLVTRSRLGTEPFGPLLLDRDIVIADVSADGAHDAPMLVDAALARGRRVVVLPNDLIADDREIVLKGRALRSLGPLGHSDLPLALEVTGR
jgi:hypothetical protein